MTVEMDSVHSLALLTVTPAEYQFGKSVKMQSVEVFSFSPLRGMVFVDTMVSAKRETR